MSSSTRKPTAFETLTNSSQRPERLERLERFELLIGEQVDY